jgi:hypothetical protein
MPHWDVTSTEIIRVIVENYSTIMPILLVIAGFVFGIRLMEHLRQSISGVLNHPNDRTIEVQSKRKNDEMFIPAEMPEKPKRQIVRVGDDGELIYDDAINNN